MSEPTVISANILPSTVNVGDLPRGTIRAVAIVALLGLVLSACRTAEEPGITSSLSGSIVLADSTDLSPNNSGFQVLVLSPKDGRVDTLAHAFTDDDGRFSTTVRAPEKGIYPLVIRRSGGILKNGQIVIAQDDSASIALRLPAGARPIVIRSQENGAWMAYQNAKAVYNNSMAELVQRGQATSENFRTNVIQSAGLMWRMSSVYPNTVGANLGAVESMMMLASLRSADMDSVVVERARSITPDNPGYIEAGRVAWRSTARIEGLGSAVDLLKAMQSQVDAPEKQAALQSEIVLAYQDSLRFDDARQAANRILAAYNNTEWGGWAESAIYELDHLRPGLDAPDFDVTALDGRRVKLSSIQTEWVVLEFYEPRNVIYQRELSAREAYLSSEASAAVTFVSVSLEPDRDLNDAFLERELGGIHVVAERGYNDDLSKLYNVKALPKRFLIRNGVIVGKYSGQALGELLLDLTEMPV